MISNYISYFHKCYQADNKEAGVLNFFSSKYEQQLIIKNEEELINNQYPIQFLPEKQAVSCLQTLALFENDKELWYGSFFCLGKRNNFKKQHVSIAAPLFLYKADIEKIEEDYFIKIDPASRQLNIAFCKSLLYTTSFDEFYRAVEPLLDNEPYTNFEFANQFKRIVEEHIENLNFDSDYLLYPKLKNQTYLKKQLQNIEQSEVFTLVTASGIFISSKANNSNSVVNELEFLSEKQEYSKGLQAFFSIKTPEKSIIKNPVKIPLLLNASQERVVQNASKYEKSVIFGPPGTGKTYTINAIAQDYVSKGKSVLIVTKTEQALHVISDKLMSSKIGNFAIKVGGNYYKRTLLAKLKKISNGYYYRHNHKNEARIATKEQDTLFTILKTLEREFIEKTEKEIERIEKLLSDTFIHRTVSKLDIHFIRVFEQIEWRIIEKYFKTLTLFEKKADEALLKNLISTLISYTHTELQKLVTLTNIFQTTEKSLINQQLQALDAKPLTHFLPIWLVKIDEIATCLPLQKDLFDIAIVDEATQCDIASCLPVFQRAKKIVVAGDTNQLRHISFLSKAQMHRFQQQHQIKDAIRFDFRKKSLLDFTLEHTAGGNQIVLLDEHYRSLPDIIRFSNQQFYGEALRVMTQTPLTVDKKAVFLHKIEGHQDENGTNTEEAIHIIKHVQQIITKEQSLHKSLASSIGVLSPFRQQTNYLTKLLKESFDLETIKKHRIKLGTPYHFQGEERDIMLLSMVVSKHSHFASINYLNKEDVFNVAITRARHEQHIFYAIDSKSLQETSLLRTYLRSFEYTPAPLNNSLPEEDTFSKEIQAFLKPFKLTIHVGYTIAGLSIDLLVENNHNYLGIDLIGYPGSFTAAFDIERYRILHRVGIQIVPVSFLSWVYHKEEVKKQLTKMMAPLLKEPK